MPDCIYDYADSFNSKNSTVKDEANFEKFASCGPMANPICNLKSNIKENFSVKNIFLDIPYTNYDDCEKAIQEVLKAFDLNPVAAKDKLTSNAVLCKVCRLIKCCKYGITDISSGSNSVSYEYGLMHGLGMKVCLLLRKENEKFTDIHGLEHIPYDGVLGFKIAVAKWILNNIESVDVGKVNNYIRQNEAILATTGEISLQKNYPKFKVDALKGISFTETDSIVFKILGDLIIEKNDAGRMVDAGVIMDKAKILGIDENVTMESLEIFESRMRCIKILKNMGLPRTYHVAMLFNGFLHYCENSLSDFNNLFLDTIYLIFNKNLKSSADVSSKLGCKLVVANSIFEYLESHNYISLNQYTSREDVSIFSFTAEGKRYFKDMLKLDVRPRNIS